MFDEGLRVIVGLAKAANIIDRILRVYFKTAVGCYAELHADSVSFCSSFTRYFHLAGAAGYFHEFRNADVKSELAAGHDYTDSFA